MVIARKAGYRAKCDSGPSARHPGAGHEAGVGRGRRAASLPGFRSAQEIHAELRRQGETVGLTTVYRHLQVLSEQGVIDTIRDPSGEALYRQCDSTAHHHHLTCRDCGRSVEVEGRAVEQWAEKVAAEAGFTAGRTTRSSCSACAPITRWHASRLGYVVACVSEPSTRISHQLALPSRAGKTCTAPWTVPSADSIAGIRSLTSAIVCP